MYKLLNIFFLVLISIFFFGVFKYYSSNNNVGIKDFNRQNIDQIINDKISNLSVLVNDTNNVIEFNDSFSNDIEKKRSRSFWNLIKSK
jgi:hypothetical protein